MRMLIFPLIALEWLGIFRERILAEYTHIDRQDYSLI